MHPFDFQLRTRIVFGMDRVVSLGELARELGARRVLMVSDPGVVATGHTQRGMNALRAARIEVALFDDVRENPTTDDVERAVACAHDFQPDLLIALGGGSAMDCCKGANFIYTNGGRMQDYWGVGKATKEMLPMIAVPTTAGTGSEAQSFALISNAQTHVKMACGDKKAACRVALLDPRLTVTQPRRVTALTGIDALTHAVETYVTKPRNPMSQALSREAWRLLSVNLPRVLDQPESIEARAGMQLGACFAGMAIENSMLGAAHALANPLTAEYGIAHGQAVGLMLPHVIRFNGHVCGKWYEELVSDSRGVNNGLDARAGVEGLAGFVGSLLQSAGLADRLADCGVRQDRLPSLAEQAAAQWTGTFNPRAVQAEACLDLYRQAY
jgi:alcohol dehydrogenase